MTPAPSLRRSARSGARTGVAAGVTEQVLSVVTTLVLVRILSPADFGLVVVANSALAMVALLAQFGIGPALVRRKDLDPADASTAFWLACGLGLALGVVSAGVAPAFSSALGQPAATSLLLILAPAHLFRLGTSVPKALLLRELRFRAAYTCEIVGALVYTTAQIGLALAGAGAYAVVVGQLLSLVTMFGAFLVATRWRPALVFRREHIREDLRFGSGVFAALGLTFLNKNLDYWLISRTLGASSLGVYYIAYVLPNILRQRLTWISTGVLYPVFAKISDDVERSRVAYVRSLELHALAGFPSMTGIAVLAGPLVHTFFGGRFAGAEAPLQLLALAALFEFATQAATTVFLARGRPSRNVAIEVVRLLALVAGLAWAATVGDLQAVALAVLGATATAAVAAQIIVCRHLRLAPRRLAAAVAPLAATTVVMALTVLGVATSVDGLPPAAQLAVLLPTGVAVFLAAGLVLFRRDSTRLLREVRVLVVPSRD